MFVLLQDGFLGGIAQKDNHLGLTTAIVCGLICGVAVKVVDLAHAGAWPKDIPN